MRESARGVASNGIQNTHIDEPFHRLEHNRSPLVTIGRVGGQDQGEPITESEGI
jgi:hypothetical protein